MKKVLFAFAIVTVALYSDAQVPDWQWGRYAVGQGTQETYHCTTDHSGNAYLAGNFQNDVTFGSTTMTLFGLGMFLAKFDPAGNLIWLRVAGGIGSNGLYQCTTDDDANIYITGRFANSMTIGPYTLTNLFPTVTHIFVAKYDSSGNVLWAKSVGDQGGNPDMAWTVHVDHSSNVYISGKIETDTIPLDSIHFWRKEDHSFLLNTMLPELNSGHEMYLAIILCCRSTPPPITNANIYITGYWFGDSLVYPGATYYNNGPSALYEIFICSFDSSGNFQMGEIIWR
jgi:hypothetical protein